VVETTLTFIVIKPLVGKTCVEMRLFNDDRKQNQFLFISKGSRKNGVVSRAGVRERMEKVRETERRLELEMAWVEKSDHWKRHLRIYGKEQINVNQNGGKRNQPP
jgi:hypothetical protein